MKYTDLRELIRGSASSREFFLSLPVPVQMRLHEQNSHIHSLFELHRNAAYIRKYGGLEEKVDKSRFM